MNNEQLHQMMERYNQELREMQKRSRTTPVSPPAPAEKEEIPQMIFEPETQQEQESMETPEPETQRDPVFNNGIILNNDFVPPVNDIRNAPDVSSGEPESSIGKLQVQVFISDRAEPIENAIVIITPTTTSETEPLTYYTDNSGSTPVVELATVSASLSQQPENFSPFSTYDVTVSANGYFTIQNKNLPIFDGQMSILPVKMIPLPENYMGNDVLVYDESSSQQQL